MRIKNVVAIVALALIGLAGNAGAANFSFTGNFIQDDNVQLFSFSVGAPSTVTLRTWSYAGGINAAGQSIARGGFDPILALFDSTGSFINQNDDGGPLLVPADSVTGQNWDTFLSALLGTGIYTVAVMQYDNFATGPNLSDGFDNTGAGNFTPALSGNLNCPLGAFVDVSGSGAGSCRDSHWAFDVLNVNAAEVVTVPEPASLALLGLGLAGLGFSRRRKA